MRKPIRKARVLFTVLLMASLAGVVALAVKSSDPDIQPVKAGDKAETELLLAQDRSAASGAAASLPPATIPAATGTAAGTPRPAAPPATVRALPAPAEPGAWIDFSGRHSAKPSSVEPRMEKLTDGYLIKLDIPGIECNYRQVDGETYAALALPGWSQRAEVGRPAIPAKTLMLDLPAGITPHVQLAAARHVRISPLMVYPAQPLLPDVYPAPPPPAFRKDAQNYAADELWPASNIIRASTAMIRNRRILILDLAAVQANGAKAEALAAEYLEIHVVFEADPAAGREMLSDGAATGTPSKYMILMHDQFTNNAVLAEFAAWKRQKGYDVNLVKTSDIDPDGAPTNGQIVAYMRNLPAEDYPEFMLIIGDHTPTNGVEGTYMITDQGGWSDLDIARRNTNDFIADMFHGRIPAGDNDQLTRMLGKALAMDRNPPTNNCYQKVCVAGMLQDSVNSNVAERLFCETSDLIASYFEHNPNGVQYACVRSIVNPNNVDADCRWSPESILWNADDRIGTRVFDHFVDTNTAHQRIADEINSGIALIQHRDHGFEDGTGWGDPTFVTDDVMALTNAGMTPVVFSVNCASGAYHFDRFLRAWLKNPDGGAYAVFAPVDISFSWYNDWLTHGFYAGFLTNYVTFQNNCTTPTWSKKLPPPSGVYGQAGSARRLGEILNFGKLYMRQNYDAEDNYVTFALFHLFGDPESHIQLLEPAEPAISHPASIHAGHPVTMAVSNLTDDALVCVYSAAMGIQEVARAAGGRAELTVTASTTGTVCITVTGYATRPYQTNITVSAMPTPAPADFDGDGKADPAIFDATGHWHIWPSAGGYVYAGPYHLTINGHALPAPADFDGDGKADPAVCSTNGAWYIWSSAANYTRLGPFELSQAGQQPAPADFDGDGKADPAVYSGGAWTAWMSASGYAPTGPFQLGTASHTAAPGDFDGDGKADPAVYADAAWDIWPSAQNYAHTGPHQLDVDGYCIPAPADFDGDGRADPAVYTEQGTWYAWPSGNNYVRQGPLTFNIPGD